MPYTFNVFTGNLDYYQTSSGTGSPGGANTQVQYNNAGAFGGITGATTDGTNLSVTTQTFGDNTTKAASTAFVQAAALGQNFKEAVRVATTGALVGVYNNGSSGVGATFIYTATGTDVIDGVTLALNDRVLVKNQGASDLQNGIYTVTTAGAIGVAGILTRATDANQSGEFKTGDSVFVTAGTTLSATTWAYTGIDSPTMGTTSLTYVQVAGQGSFTGGTGITITGTSIAIDTSVTVDKTTVQTLTNKTLTSPTIAALANLTTNGIVYTTGSNGTLNIATKIFQLLASNGAPSFTTGAVPNRQESATNKVNTYILDFADSNSKLFAEWGMVLPNDYVTAATITAQFVWYAPSTSTNSVVWGLQAVAYGDLTTLDTAYGTAQEATDAHSSTASQVQLSPVTSAITIAGSPAAGQWIQFRAYRDSSNASDTLAQTASLLGVIINY